MQILPVGQVAVGIAEAGVSARQRREADAIGNGAGRQSAKQAAMERRGDFEWYIVFPYHCFWACGAIMLISMIARKLTEL